MSALGKFPKYIDGYYGTPVRISRTPKKYPFAGNGDVTTAMYDATYLVDIGKFTPTARGTVDPENAGFYLVNESKPEIVNGDIAQFVRTYAKIPLEQTVPGSIFVTKPEIAGTFPQAYGAFVMNQPDETVASYDQYVPQTVTADTGGATGGFTGGTFTLSYGASTTSALSYQATASDVQTALNAISSISTGTSGVAVTGTMADGFTVTFASYLQPTGINTASLTRTGGSSINAVSSDNALPGGPGEGMDHSIAISTADAAQSITGGTFTLTFFGQTTAGIAYNASAAAVASAINALSNVSARGGVSVFLNSGASSILSSSNLIWFRVRFANFGAISGSATSLAPAGSTLTVDPTTYGGAYQKIQKISLVAAAVSARVFTAPAHGLTISDDIFVLVGTTYFFLPSGTFTVPDANSIAVTTTAGLIFTADGLASRIGKQVGSYTAGLKLTRCKRIQTFYLPGVTPGISTADDIPLPDYDGSPTELLAAIFAGSTQINIEVGELAQWEGSPILARTVTQINASTL